MSCCDLTLTVQEEDPITLEITEATIKPEQSKTVTPTYSEQTVLPDAGMTLGSVVVDAIPEPTDRLTITENGSYDVARIGGVDVDVPQGLFPSGTLDIKGNGVANVREYEYVNVDTRPEHGVWFEDFDADGYPRTFCVCGYSGLVQIFQLFNGNTGNIFFTKRVERVAIKNCNQVSLYRNIGITQVTVDTSGAYAIGNQQWSGLSLLLADFSKCDTITTLASVNSFGHVSGCIIRVPAALLDEWQSAPVWRDLQNVIFEGV